MDEAARVKITDKIKDTVSDWALARDSLKEWEAEYATVFETHRLLISEYNLKLEMARSAMKELDVTQHFEEGFETRKRTTTTVNLNAVKPYLHRQMLLDNPDLISSVDVAGVVASTVDHLIQNPQLITGVNPKTLQKLIDGRAFPAKGNYIVKDDTVAVYAPKPLSTDA